MPEQRDEILKYSLDLTEVEAGAQRLNELLAQMKAKRGAGEDTSELEQMFQKELASLEQVIPAQRRAAGGAEDLLRQKEKLAAVTGLLGSRIGGTVGQLGNLAELFIALGPAAAGAAAAMAGMAGFAEIIKRAREELQALDKMLEQYNKTREEFVQQQQQPAEQIERTLLGFGAAEKGRAEQVYKYALSLAGMGVAPELALGIAPTAQVAGLSERQAAMLAIGSTAEGGRMPKTPAEAAAMAGRLEGEGGAQLAQQLAALPGTATGARSIALVARVQNLYQDLEDQFRGVFAPDTDQLLREYAKTSGIDLKALAAEKPEDWGARLQEMRGRRAGLGQVLDPGPYGAPGMADVFMAHQADKLDKQIAILEQLVLYQQTLVELLSGAGAGGRAPSAAGEPYRAGDVFNIGTQINAPKKQHQRWRPVMGASKQDHRAPPG